LIDTPGDPASRDRRRIVLRRQIAWGPHAPREFRQFGPYGDGEPVVPRLLDPFFGRHREPDPSDWSYLERRR
jgi:hypothetical protein